LVSLVIRYRNPRRPDEGGMTMIADREQAETIIKRLERQGYLVEKITFAPLAKSAQAD
jgi:hypothetical protein